MRGKSIDLASGEEIGVPTTREGVGEAVDAVGRIEAKALDSALSLSLSVDESALSSSSDKNAARPRLPSEASPSG